MKPFFFIVLASIAAIYGANVYVSVGGTGDGSQANPFGTINQAVQYAATNATITNVVVSAGTFTGATVNPSGLTLTITGAGASTILKCSTPPLIQLTHSNDVFTLVNFTISSCFGAGGAVAVKNGSTLITNGVIFQGLGSNQVGAIYVDGGRLSVMNSIFDSNRATSIVVEDTQGVGNVVANISSSRFTKNAMSSTYGVACVFGRPSVNPTILVQDSIFISNAGALYVSTVTLYRNKFFDNGNSTTNVIQCAGNPGIIHDGTNQFCGAYGNQVSCPAYTAPTLVKYDACGICNGDNSQRDCNGTCFSTLTGCVHNTYYVRPFSSGTGTAINPFGTIQSAINACSNYGDTVILYEGNYTGTGNTGLTFSGKTIYLKSVYQQPDATILSCSSSAPVFQLNSKESFDSIIEGLTITRCNSPAFSFNEASATVRNCVVNMVAVTTRGAAFFLTSSFAVIQNTQVLNNNMSSGGALYITGTNQKISDVKVINSRFLSNSGGSSAGGAIYVDAYSAATISGSVFQSNAAGGGARDINVVASATSVVITSSSFFSATSSSTSIECVASVNQSSSFSCGGTPAYNCPSLTAPQSVTQIDACNVCNGNGGSADCNGTCFGFFKPDGRGGCCHPRNVDCAGRCNGGASYDRLGVCCTGVIDCDSICNGSKIFDSTGDGCCLVAQMDCVPVCFGNKSRDNAGGCCLRANFDNCSICFGNGTTCRGTSAALVTSAAPVASATSAAVAPLPTTGQLNNNNQTNVQTSTSTGTSNVEDHKPIIAGYGLITVIVAAIIIFVIILAIIIIIVFLVNRRRKRKGADGTGVEMKNWY